MPLTVAQIRIVAGVLAVIVLFIIIWRRKKKASE
jgi:tryptophan-rich sensory protein